MELSTLGTPSQDDARRLGTPFEAPQTGSPSSLYATLTSEETAVRLHTSLTNGLVSQQDALYRRSIHGLNVLEGPEQDTLWRKFFGQFRESPLILLLLGCAVVSVIMGKIDDAISITLVRCLVRAIFTDN